MRHEVTKGRGATLQIEGRFERVLRERVDDGWGMADEELPPFRTTVTVERAKSVIQCHDSSDLPFSLSLNAYRGCEHGCIYCYARPSHGYLNLSPGLDFETKLFAKPDAPQLLRAELAKPSYCCSPIALGSNTDPYQPIERDLDLLAQLARDNLVQVSFRLPRWMPGWRASWSRAHRRRAAGCKPCSG